MHGVFFDVAGVGEVLLHSEPRLSVAVESAIKSQQLPIQTIELAGPLLECCS